MRRLLLIARREYVAYVKTVGFWLSLLATPVLMGIVYGGPILLQRNAPQAQVSVIDQTDSRGMIIRNIERRVNERGGIALRPAPATAASETNHIAAGKLFQPMMTGPKDNRLDVGIVVYRDGPQVRLDIWSRNQSGEPMAEGMVRDAVSDWMRGDMLAKAGVDPRLAGALQTARPATARYSASGEGLGFINSRLPGLVSFGLAMLLFMLVTAGAGILLNGVIEEKSSRVLEVMLTSAEPSEILFGKILGAAGIAGTIVTMWAGIGIGVLAAFQPEMAQAVGALLLGKGLIFYFLLYLVGGYLMYAAIFTALGSFCETTREAQSLLGPLMMLLFLPVIVMTQSLARPDMPLVTTLSWVPNFTPFLMMSRAASHPPLWQVAGTALVMLGFTGLVVWGATRAFRAGALTSGKVSLAAIFSRIRQGE